MNIGPLQCFVLRLGDIAPHPQVWIFAPPTPFSPSTQNFWYFPNFSKFLFPTRNFTISLLKMDPNIYRKTTFALKMWSKTHIWTSLQFLCDSDQKVTIFVEKLKKMQPPKMTFRSQLEPSIKSYECFMFLQNFGLEIIMDWWILERPKSLFFFQKPRKSKNALYYQKNLRFLCEIYQ